MPKLAVGQQQSKKISCYWFPPEKTALSQGAELPGGVE